MTELYKVQRDNMDGGRKSLQHSLLLTSNKELDVAKKFHGQSGIKENLGDFLSAIQEVIERLPDLSEHKE